MSLKVEISKVFNLSGPFNESNICPLTGYNLLTKINDHLCQLHPIPYLAAAVIYEVSRGINATRYVDGAAAVEKLNSGRFNILSGEKKNAIKILFFLFTGNIASIALKEVPHPDIVSITHWQLASEDITVWAKLFTDPSVDTNRSFQIDYIYYCLRVGKGRLALNLLSFIYPLSSPTAEGSFLRGIIYAGLTQSVADFDLVRGKDFLIAAQMEDPDNLIYKVAYLLLEMNIMTENKCFFIVNGHGLYLSRHNFNALVAFKCIEPRLLEFMMAITININI